MRLAYRLIRAFLQLFFALFTRFVVVGREALPCSGPLIVATNHIGILDPPALMVAAPWPVTAFAAKKWSRHFWGHFLRSVGAIFVNRGEVDREALRSALRVLERGGILGMAPEGTRSKTRRLQPARPGVAYLAHLSGAPIVPVAITGTERVLPSLLRLQRAEVRVTFGEPFTLPAVDRRARAGNLLEQADLVMQRIAALLPPEYRGAYAKPGLVRERSPAPRG